MKKPKKDYRNFFKVTFFERVESAEKIPGSKIVNGKAKPFTVPARLEFIPTEGVELRGDFTCDLVFNSFRVFMERVYKRSPQTKAVVLHMDDGFMFLRLFCWNQKRDDEFRQSDVGRQIHWMEDLSPKGVPCTGIDGFGIGYFNEPDSIELADGPFDFYRLFKKFMAHKPECGSFFLKGNKLIMEMRRGSDIDRYQNMVSRVNFSETKSEREDRMDTQRERQSESKKHQFETEMKKSYDEYKEKKDQGFEFSSNVDYKESRRPDVPATDQKKYFGE